MERSTLDIDGAAPDGGDAEGLGHERSSAQAGLDLGSVGERIESLLDASSAGGITARERAEELVRLVTDLYGHGLERMLDLLYDAGRLDEKALTALAGDELVSGLLLVHGLHPWSVTDRVEQALEEVRPYLGSHGGDVELLDVTEEATVRLRLLGSCDGCPSSSVTLKLAVEGAIEKAAPEVESIEVEEASEEAARGLIPVDALRSRLQDGGPEATAGLDPTVGAEWHDLPPASLVAGEVVAITVAGCSLVVCRVGEQPFAFADRCARCEGSLAGAAPAQDGSASTLACPVCGSRYELTRAGTGIDDPDLHLDPHPVLAQGDGYRVALPAVTRT